MRAVSLAAAATLGASVMLTSLAAGPAAADALGGGKHKVRGKAHLTGEQEVGHYGDPDGRGRFRFVAKDHKLCYSLRIRNVEDPNAAHIHFGPRGENGPIAVTLKTPREDGKVRDCIRARNSQNRRNAARVLTFWELKGIKQDTFFFYVNVHSDNYEDGAIRGQLRRTR